MDKQPITDRTPDTQALWTDAEKALLRQFAPKTAHKQTLLKAFPGRTLGSIKTHLSAVRRELELPKRPGSHNLVKREMRLTILDKDEEGLATESWQEVQRPILERANQKYLAALMSLAA